MLIRSDLLRAIYLTMLMEFPAIKVRDFWSANPLDVGHDVLDEFETYDSLWHNRHEISLAYATRVLSNLEWFLVKENWTLRQFINRMIAREVTRSVIPPRTLLRILEPYAGLAAQTDDIGGLLLALIHRVHRFVAPGSIFKVVNSVRKKDVYEKDLLLSYDPECKEKYFVDVETWALKMIENAQSAFNLSCFDSVRTLADCRTIPMIINGCGPKITTENGRLYLDGELYGEEMEFQSFAESNNLALHRYPCYPSCKVMAVHHDYWCPVRRLVALREGACYGAPFYILRVTYRQASRRCRRFLAGVVAASTSVYPQSDEIVSRHFALAHAAGDAIAITYCKNRNEVLVRGSQVARGTPARVLHKVVNAYIHEGKKEFGYHELRADPELMFHPKKPNIDIHLKRLQEHLKKICPCLAIVRNGKGRFSFQSEVKIDMKEI
jgi:hypothetical protein